MFHLMFPFCRQRYNRIQLAISANIFFLVSELLLEALQLIQKPIKFPSKRLEYSLLRGSKLSICIIMRLDIKHFLQLPECLISNKNVTLIKNTQALLFLRKSHTQFSDGGNMLFFHYCIHCKWTRDICQYRLTSVLPGLVAIQFLCQKDHGCLGKILLFGIDIGHHKMS